MTESLPPIESLPPRIPASLVCKYAGYSKATLSKRIRNGEMVSPIDRGKENMFSTAEVMEKLGIKGNSAASINPFEKALDAFKASTIR